MKVVLTTGAVGDLQKIALHIAKDNPPRARSFVAELQGTAIRLGDMPGLPACSSLRASWHFAAVPIGAMESSTPSKTIV